MPPPAVSQSQEAAMGMSRSQEHLIRERNRQLDEKPAAPKPRAADRAARQSEFPVSEHGMNQESEHNKHNRPAKGAPKH
jgi:hypothetical protein